MAKWPAHSALMSLAKNKTWLGKRERKARPAKYSTCKQQMGVNFCRSLFHYLLGRVGEEDSEHFRPKNEEELSSSSSRQRP